MARVGCLRQSVVPDVEPRKHREGQSVHREVELVRCGDSKVCDGCNVAQIDAEAKLHREGCRECIRRRESIRHTMMSDGMGQQMLLDMKQRRERQEGRF